MSIAKMVIRQRDFSVGEIDPDAERRDDLPMFKASVREASNMQFLSTGGLERRSGRAFLYADEGVRDDFRLLPDMLHNITFAHLRATVRDENGAVVTTLSAPWVSANIAKLTWTSHDNLIIVCGPDMRPQVIELNKATYAWSIRDYNFKVNIDGTVCAPYYRFANYGVTMKFEYSGGAIAVTFSAPVLENPHVGVVFRYAGKQLRIISVISSTSATAAEVEPLNPTIRYGLVNASENTFIVGQIVKTSIGGVEGEVVLVDKPGNTVTIVVLNRWRLGPGTDDRLIGPTGDAEINASTFVSPAATTQWDEQFMSDNCGWPQSVSKDAQRIIFSDFDQLKSAIAWTALNEPFDMLITDDATSEIVEMIEADCRVYHVVGGYDRFAVTDVGVFYIPISAENPLRPGSVEFRRVYAGGVANVRPVQVTEGVVFVDSSQTGIYAVSATGQTARPYIANELTQFHRHLFRGIKALAASSGTPEAPTRQIFAINADGSVVIGQFNVEGQYVGWLPWAGQGEVHSIAARMGDVVLSTRYTGGNGDIYVAEQVKPDLLFDCKLKVGSSDLSFLAGTTVQVLADSFYMGDVVVGAGGVITGFDAFADVWIGFSYDWHVIPNLQDFEGGEAFGQRLRRRKVSRVNIKVRDTQEFRIGNRLLAGYEGGDDTALPMPLRRDVYQYRELGRSYDPQYKISQTIPGKFKLLELTTELTI